MRTEDFSYDLPERFIAQFPVEPRDHSRLLTLNRKTGEIEHHYFYELPDFLTPGDLLVVNNTRVIPARLFGKKSPGGGKVEILLLRKLTALEWECLVGGKHVNEGLEIAIKNGPKARIARVLQGSKRLIRFDNDIEQYLDRAGQMPLPPYIHSYHGNPERYQTVYNAKAGSAAAPTAGLHFTQGLIETLLSKGVQFTTVDLHVGLDTFAPVTEEDPQTHLIHQEWCELSQESADLINQTRRAGGRIIAVGTTSVRTLESAAAFSSGDGVQAWSGETSLYILPGYIFKIVDAMITNFHLPKSTLLMLVSAFAGRGTILGAYQLAKDNGYRFFSFGDATFLY